MVAVVVMVGEEEAAEAEEDRHLVKERFTHIDRIINVHGDYYEHVGQILAGCSTVIQEQASGETQKLLETLQAEVQELIKSLPEQKQAKAAKDFKGVVEGVTSDPSKRAWYSVSAKGLLEASKFAKEFTGNLAGTIGELRKLVIPGK